MHFLHFVTLDWFAAVVMGGIQGNKVSAGEGDIQGDRARPARSGANNGG